MTAVGPMFSKRRYVVNSKYQEDICKIDGFFFLYSRP
jgi:hypothetical protein